MTIFVANDKTLSTKKNLGKFMSATVELDSVHHLEVADDISGDGNQWDFFGV